MEPLAPVLGPSSPRSQSGGRREGAGDREEMVARGGAASLSLSLSLLEGGALASETRALPGRQRASRTSDRRMGRRCSWRSLRSRCCDTSPLLRRVSGWCKAARCDGRAWPPAASSPSRMRAPIPRPRWARSTHIRMISPMVGLSVFSAPHPAGCPLKRASRNAPAGWDQIPCCRLAACGRDRSAPRSARQFREIVAEAPARVGRGRVLAPRS